MTQMMEPATQMIEANDTKLSVRVVGEGRPLVLLHGGMFTSEFWVPAVPYFGDGYQLVLVDSRGHGRSDNPANRLNYRMMADDIAALVTEMSLDRPAVCGYSDGGKICLELAIHHQDKFGALIVGADRLNFTPEYENMVRELAFVVDGDEPDLPRFRETYPEQCEEFAQMHGGHDRWEALFRWSVAMYLEPFDITRDALAGVTIPVLMVCGDRDEGFPVEESRVLQKAIPESELAVVPGSDHYFPYFRPDVLPAIVREFLGRRLV